MSTAARPPWPEVLRPAGRGRAQPRPTGHARRGGASAPPLLACPVRWLLGPPLLVVATCRRPLPTPAASGRWPGPAAAAWVAARDSCRGAGGGGPATAFGAACGATAGRDWGCLSASDRPGIWVPRSWLICARCEEMLSFCLVRSSTSRWATARCRSSSFLVSAMSWSAWALAWATIWSAFFLALPTSCLECCSASRRVWSACALALAARCSAVAARCSASVTSFCVAACAADRRSASWRSASSRREASWISNSASACARCASLSSRMRCAWLRISSACRLEVVRISSRSRLDDALSWATSRSVVVRSLAMSRSIAARFSATSWSAMARSLAASRSVVEVSSSASRRAPVRIASASRSAEPRRSSVSRLALARSSAASFSAPARSSAASTLAAACSSLAAERASPTISVACSSARRSNCSIREPRPA